MTNFYLAASLIGITLSLGCIPMSRADVLDDTSLADANNIQSQQTTTTTNAYPSVPMSAPVASEPLTGQVQSVNYDNKFMGIGFGRNISKTLTIEPGMGQVSLDSLRWKNRVNLTLVNPSATPLQFETTQRWGKQVVITVPAHSQQMLTFSQSRPFTHDIKFFVMQQPSSAIASNQDYVTQQVESVTTVEETATREALSRQAAMIHEALNQQTAQLQSSQEEAIQKAIDQHTAANQMTPSQTRHHTGIRGYW